MHAEQVVDAAIRSLLVSVGNHALGKCPADPGQERQFGPVGLVDVDRKGDWLGRRMFHVPEAMPKQFVAAD